MFYQRKNPVVQKQREAFGRAPTPTGVTDKTVMQPNRIKTSLLLLVYYFLKLLILLLMPSTVKIPRAKND